MARNQYAGPCYLCGLWVRETTGHFERHAGGWRVRHGKVPGDWHVTCEMAAKAQQEKNHD